MKANRFRIWTVLLAAVMFITLSINVYAASGNAVTQDGLTAQLLTDKDTYQADEAVNATVRVENNTGKKVLIVTSLNLPSGVSLASGEASIDVILQRGEIWTTPGGFSVKAGDLAAVLSAATGDNMQAGFWIMMTVIAVCGLIALFVYGKNRKTWLSMLLCLAMVGGLVTAAVPVQAEDITGRMAVSCNVQVDGKSKELSATVSYTILDEEENEEVSASPEASEEPEESASPSPTPSASPEASEEPEESAIPSASPEASEEPEESASPSPTPSASPEASEEPEESASPSPTPSASPEVSASPTPTPIPEATGSESGDGTTVASAPVETTSAEGIKIYKTKEGSVIIAAEELVLDETQIKVVDNAAAVGGKAVKTIQYNNASGYLPNVETDNPSMAFGILPDQTGSYYIWARIVAKDASDDSVWMSKDGAAYKDTSLVLSPWSEDEEDFQWKRIGTITAEEGETAIIRFIPRDKDALFDRFILTTNALYTPTEGGQSPTTDMEIVELPSDVYNIPEIKPTVGEHPRVMFRTSDIPTIKDYMDEAENANALAEYKALLAEEFDGNLPAGSGNYNGEKLAIIEAKAFDYVINRNDADATVAATATANGKAAVAAIKNYIKTCTYDGLSDNSRPMGHVLFTSAEIYDWCHDLLTAEDKEEIVAGCQAIAVNMETGIPPSGGYAIQDHASEAMMQRDWLSFAIATYDEYPDIYNYAAGRFFDEFVPAKEYWFASGTQHQGSAYGPYRYMWDLWGQWLIYRMSGKTIYSESASQVAYQWIYTRRPDGQLMRDGDDYNEDNYGAGAYWNNTGNMLFYASNFYKDPVLKKEFLRQNSGISDFTYSNDTLTPVQVLVFNDPTVGKENTSTLPLTKYFASPYGAMVARTGWNMGVESSDVLAYMKISELYAAGHNHLDAGSFQIYYKGILASESGQYYYFNRPHHINYTKASVAHNTLAITSSANTNGYQVVRNSNMIPDTLPDWLKEKDGELLYQTGEVIGQEYGPNTNTPEYTYIAGDIAYAYDDNVEEAVRSMLFMPLEGEDSPAAFVVFDQITTKEVGSEKTFMLHTQSEPTIDNVNKVSVIKNTDGNYNGMLTNQTLLPADANITAIGGEGKEFWVEAGYGATGKEITETGNVELTYANVSASSAAEYGWGRIEISTTTTQENQTDYFLNVMYVDEADSAAAMEQAELIYGSAGATTNTMIGAKLFDRVAMFHGEKARTSETVTFTVPGEETELKVNVAGLTAGTWTVKVNGNQVTEAVSSEDGGIIYFTAPAGNYELVYKNAESDKEFDDTKDEINTAEIDLMVNNSYLHTAATITKSGEEILVPIKAIFEALNTVVVWNETTQTINVNYMTSSVTVKAGDNSVILNDASVDLAVAAQMDNGELLVPLSFIEDILGEYGTITFDELSLLIKISATKAEDAPELTWDIANAIQVVRATQSGDDGSNSIRNSLDGNLDTRWAVKDKGNGAWGIYDLGEVYTLDQIQLAYAQGDLRNYLFDIEVSVDGVNYTKVITNGSSCGLTTGFEAFDMGDVSARYVKYVGYGHIVTATQASGLWNSITEIVFIEKAEGGSEGGGSGSGEEIEQKYTVTFKNDDGTVISTNQYAKGDTIAVPENPTKTAAENYVYKFTGWSPSINTVATSDTTYTATYALEYIVLEAEDVVLNADSVTVEKNTAASKGKVVRTKTGPATTPATDTAGDLGFTVPAETSGTYYVWIRTAITAGGRDEIWNSKNGAAYTNSPTLRWVSGYKNIVPENAVTKTEANGSTSQYSATETDFGWRRLSINNVTAGSNFNMRFICKHADAILDMFIVTTDKDYLPDATVIKDADVEETVQYTVTFYDEDGTTVLATGTYEEGATLTPPANPTKAETETHTYEFAGWEPEVVTTVTADATYKAKYTETPKQTEEPKAQYTVTFYDEDGTTLLATGTYEEGAILTPPANPTKAETETHTYEFAGWEPEVVTTVTADAAYKAKYTETPKQTEEPKAQYTVTFYDEDGTTVLATGTYEEGATLTPPANPTKAETETHTYEFAGWEPEVVMTVTADTTYKATYTATEKEAEQVPTIKTYTVPSGGFAVFEAEDVVLDTEKITIEENTAVAAVSSGGKAIRTTTTLTTKPTSTSFENAEFGFKLNTAESGNYYVWVRMAITGAACDSIWRSENGTIKETSLLFNNTFVAPTNLNSSKTTYSASETDFGWKRLTVSSVTAGADYSVLFISREPNVLFDKFIITKDSTFRPQLDKDYDPTATTE